MNNFNFTGNIGRDCEVKQAGKSMVCEFAVAVASGYGDREKTSWVKCQLWGKRAEGGLPPYLVKGQKVVVSGELTIDEWEKDGVKNRAASVNVNSVDLIGEKKNSDQQSSPQANGAAASNDFDDDIPF